MDSLKDACRVCLEYNSESNSFFDEVEYEKCVKLAKIFEKVTNVEVTEYEDVKPCRLCQECTERLLNAYDLICSVEKAEQDIENYLMANNQLLENEPVRLECDIKVSPTELDLQDIEILDEEFQTEHDQISIGNEVIVVMNDVPTDSGEDNMDSNIEPVEVNDTKRTEDTVGSRLSKRMLSSHYKCASCQRAFAKLETLERHIKQAHTAIPREELENISNQFNSQMNDKQILCSYCPQTFKRRTNYIRHLTTNHSKVAEHLAEEDKNLIKSKNSYKRGNCPHCGKNFTQASLIIHIRRHTGEYPYQCNECEKAFPRRQDLVVHQRKHTGEKPHICTVCGKSFSRANKLARHMRVHTGERPYKCTKCQRSFAQSNDLKIHLRRHTGEKPYKCSVCKQAFICGAALRTHRRQKNHHSPEDEFDDPFANWRVCKRGLKTTSDDKDTTQFNFKVEEKTDESEEKSINLELAQIISE